SPIPSRRCCKAWPAKPSRGPELASSRRAFGKGRAEEGTNWLGKALQHVVRNLEADLGRELGVDEAIDGDLDQLTGGIDRHLDLGEGPAVFLQKGVEIGGH